MNKKHIMAALAMAMLAGGNGQCFGIPRRHPINNPREPRPVKPQPRSTQIFKVHGVEIEAYSKKDALKRYNHKYK